MSLNPEKNQCQKCLFNWRQNTYFIRENIFESQVPMTPNSLTKLDSAVSMALQSILHMQISHRKIETKLAKYFSMIFQIG